ncbi:transmembrane protein 128 isoform B [Alligator mississippiensis]|uniref:Transmembrane protein 128 isoform B n=1 Tax=Alligator mississippiensis TaxID=8496 RepID=A0A151P9J8_ALLMI|nr:transmembrane protein 128 isoform B [Alligator mississippiensis]
MEAGPSERDPFLRLRRHLRQEVESGALLQPPQDGGGAAEESTALEKKEKPLPRLNIHSAFWILASIAVTYYFEFFKTVKETIQADRIEDYDAKYPVLIPVTTATFIAAAICFNIALWPVWSIKVSRSLPLQGSN